MRPRPALAARAACLAVAAWVLLGAAAPRAAAFDLGALLDSVVETYGGTRAAARMQAYRVTAEVDARRQGGAAGRVTRDFQAPDRLRVEIAYPQATEVRILNGGRGWRGDATRLQRVEGPPRTAMEYQLLRSEIPWVFVHHRSRLEDRGEAAREAAAYRRVGLPWSPELDLTYWIDAVTRRVVWVEGAVRFPSGQTGFATRYGDFRRVEGLLVPFLEENFAGGAHTGTTRVREVVFGADGLGTFDPTRMERQGGGARGSAPNP
ncbi:MAG: hypothetical protein AB1578_07965 [Thermodesulfobacteriota bacterium]